MKNISILLLAFLLFLFLVACTNKSAEHEVSQSTQTTNEVDLIQAEEVSPIQSTDQNDENSALEPFIPTSAFITFEGPKITDVIADGLRVSQQGDIYHPIIVENNEQWAIRDSYDGWDYIYFFIDTTEIISATNVMMEVTYFDDKPGSIELNYCSSLPGDFQGYDLYRDFMIGKKGSGQYETATVFLDNCLFSMGHNQGAQFRLSGGSYTGGAIIKSVKITTTEPLVPIEEEPEWSVIIPSDPTQGTFVAAYDASKYGVLPMNEDNTPQLQALIDKIASIGGGTLYIPKGIYNVNYPLFIKTGVTIRGDWTEPKKGQPFDTINNTLFVTTYGRGKHDLDPGLVNLGRASAIVNISIWYPEQDPDAIEPYSPAITLGGLRSGQKMDNNVRNVTLINPYIGVQSHYSPEGGDCPTISGVYGTPLWMGVDVDAIMDIGRVEHLNFSPDYWSGSGLPGAPDKGSVFEKYIYENGVGLSMRRVDLSYAAFVHVDGYNKGYHAAPSRHPDSIKARWPKYGPEGHNYGFSFTNCKTGLYIECGHNVGIMFTEIKADNCETGLYIAINSNELVQLVGADFTASEEAIRIDSGQLLLNQSLVRQGVVNVNAGILSATNTVFNNAAPQINFGPIGQGMLIGNTFNEPYQINNSSRHNHIIENNVDIALLGNKLPYFSGGHLIVKMPAKQDLYVVTEAPYNAVLQPFVSYAIYTDTERISDSTKAIQDTLNEAGANGGGIVFLPPGKYRIDGSLIIPTGVELRGADGEISSVARGNGSIIEAYGYRNNPEGAPLIIMKEGSGVRGITINYPEQILTDIKGAGITPYPYTIQGQGKDVYIINVRLRNSWNGIDLSTHRCDNAYVDALSGVVFKNAIMIGNGGRNIDVRNMQFNPRVYDWGATEHMGSWVNSKQFYDFSISPHYTPHFLHEYLIQNSELLVIGDCDNLSLYNNFGYGHYIGMKLINQSTGGPKNLISLGYGLDIAVYPIFFDSGINGNMDFINSQLLTNYEYSKQPDSCYIYAAPDSSFQGTFYNVNCYGIATIPYILERNSGTVELQTVVLGYGSGTERLIKLQGSDLKIINSQFSSTAPLRVNFSGDISNMSVISSIFYDFSNLNLSSTKHNIGNYIGMRTFEHRTVENPMIWEPLETEAKPEGDILKYDVIFKTVSSSDYAYSFNSITKQNYTVAAGDMLEYDVRISTNISGIGAIDGVINGESIRDNLLNIDQYGSFAHPGGSLVDFAFNNWFRRKIDISHEQTIGKKLTEIQLATHPGLPEQFSGITATIWYDNIRITNNGIVKLVIFESAEDINISRSGLIAQRNASAKVSIVNINDSN